MHLEDEFPINNGTVKVKKPGKAISGILLGKVLFIHTKVSG